MLWEMVYWYLVLRGESFFEVKRRMESVLKEFNLWEYKDKLCFSLFGGLKRRVFLVLIVVISVEFIFFDEFILGLDLFLKCEIWRLILEFREEIFFFVIMNVGLEVESLVKIVVIINRG